MDHGVELVDIRMHFGMIEQSIRAKTIDKATGLAELDALICDVKMILRMARLEKSHDYARLLAAKHTMLQIYDAIEPLPRNVGISELENIAYKS